MRVVTTFCKRVGRLLSVFVVVLISLVAGLFLTACRKAQPEKSTPEPAPKPAAAADTGKEKEEGKGKEEAKQKGKLPDLKKPTVDVEETEKGQPIPRNLLE